MFLNNLKPNNHFAKWFILFSILRYISLHDKNFNDVSKIKFSEHHYSHAASAFYPSPFKDAVILTLDGVGEWATTTVAVGTPTTSTRTVTPRKLLPLQRRQRMEDLRRQELESMRLLHSEQELELTRLQQANKLMVEENTKLKKVSSKNKELMNK